MTTITKRVSGALTEDTTKRVAGAPVEDTTARVTGLHVRHQLLLEDGSGALALEGDMTDGDDLLLLEGDAAGLQSGLTRRVTGI